ncbi:MAG: VWA domain-containing protein [Acidobacteriota bacterium]|jgi:Ca-activated chloride channel family protein|nr:VWA domain-containing protein [Acidobacteriota bacterium]
MRYRYSDYPVDLLRGLLTYQELVKLFLQIVLQTGGDVEEALQWMKYLQERGMIDEGIDLDAFRKELEKSEMVEDQGGKLQLTAAGERRIRRSALEEIFTSLSKSGPGYHAIPRAGGGGELLPETRGYEFGDNPTAIDGIRTIGNAVRRDADDITLKAEDFEVHEEEHLTSCATVLAIDISHSMILYGEDRFTPAKKVALALVELIQSKYPKDSVDVILFGDDAKRVPISEISKTMVGPYHTNTRAGLALARKLLVHRKNPNKQIFLITDGKPSAIWERGRLYKNPFGLDLKIVNRTLEEADACRRDGITITTFMIATDSYLVDFVDKLTKINRGRAYYASPYNLAEFLFTDYIRNRKKFFH